MFFCSDRVFRVNYLEDAIWYDHRSRLEYVNSLKLPNKTCGHNTGVNSRLIGLVEYCGVGISPRIWFCGDALIEVGKGPLAMADSDRAPLYYSASLIQCWQITVFAFEIYYRRCFTMGRLTNLLTVWVWRFDKSLRYNDVFRTRSKTTKR